MSDVGSSPASDESERLISQSAGTLIRSARERAGIHVAALAVAMKIPVRKLEALEANQWDQLADITFARALAASVCRHLKVDSQPVLALMPNVSRTVEVPDTGNRPSFPQERGVHTGALGGDRIPKSYIVAVALILSGAALLWMWPFVLSTLGKQLDVPRGDISSSSGAGPSSAIARPMHPASPSPGSSDSPGADAQPATARTQPGSWAQAPTSPVQPGASASNALSERASEPTASSALPSGEAAVVLVATDTSWVRVIDRGGVALISRMMQEGETVRLTGRPPLSVTIGNAEGTQVVVYGKPFDVKGVAKDNVARFEVK